MQRLAEDAVDAVTVREARAAAAPTERLCIATRQVRPVGELIRFVVGPDGALYLSDDKAGFIYRIAYSG